MTNSLAKITWVALWLVAVVLSSCSNNPSLEFPSEKEWLEKWFPGSSSSVSSSSSERSSSSECKDMQLNPLEKLCDERDNKVYNLIRLDNSFWMAENLNYAATDSKCGTETETLTDENTAICDVSGRLYDWATAMNPDICPPNWRIPTGVELEDFMNRFDFNNFNIQRGGYGFLGPPNKFLPGEGHWWLKEQGGNTFGINLVLYPNNVINQSSQMSKSNYASVRCIAN